MSNTMNLPILEEHPDAVPIEVLASPHPTLPDYFYRTNDRGLIEAIDKVTGRILAVQASPHDLLKEKWEKLVRIDTPEGPVFLERGLNFDLTNKLKANPYSKVLADLLCQKIVEGKTLLGACKEMNLKYTDILSWRREEKEFAKNLETAKTDRADAFHDEVVDIAREKASTKDTIKALQWAAGKGNREKYGTKDSDQTFAGNVTIVIGTGITRPGDAGYIPPPKEVVELNQAVALAVAPEEKIEEFTGGSSE